MTSKTGIVGERLLKRCIERDKDHGGLSTEITGAMGMSKTGVLLFFGDTISKKYPGEKVFFREQYNSPLQIFKMGSSKYTFLVQEGSKVVFRNREKRLEKTEINHKRFTDFNDLYEKASPGKINVVFFKSDDMWMDFIEYLREVGEWTTVLIDEMADICPYPTSGNRYKKIGSFASTVGAVRRCMISLFYNTQTVKDIDWRVRSKAMIRVFLPGAIADTKNSRVTQKAIDNLDINPGMGNEAYLSSSGEFGKIRFTRIYKPNPRYNFEAYVDGKWAEEETSKTDV